MHNHNLTPSPRAGSKAVTAFKQASAINQDLLKTVLREERDVQHLQRRSDIHARIYEHISRIIK